MVKSIMVVGLVVTVILAFFGCQAEASVVARISNSENLAGIISKLQDGKLPLGALKVTVFWLAPDVEPEKRWIVSFEGSTGVSVFLSKGQDVSSGGTRKLEITREEMIALLRSIDGVIDEPHRPRYEHEPKRGQLKFLVKTDVAGGHGRVLIGYLDLPLSAAGELLLKEAKTLAISSPIIGPEAEVELLRRFEPAYGGCELNAWRMIEIGTKESLAVLREWLVGHKFGRGESNDAGDTSRAMRNELLAKGIVLPGPVPVLSSVLLFYDEHRPDIQLYVEQDAGGLWLETISRDLGAKRFRLSDPIKTGTIRFLTSNHPIRVLVSMDGAVLGGIDFESGVTWGDKDRKGMPFETEKEAVAHGFSLFPARGGLPGSVH